MDIYGFGSGYGSREDMIELLSEYGFPVNEDYIRNFTQIFQMSNTTSKAEFVKWLKEKGYIQ